MQIKEIEYSNLWPRQESSNYGYLDESDENNKIIKTEGILVAQGVTTRRIVLFLSLLLNVTFHV